jgi:EAL domain-containing protein (putative c-di-GMP-specific phosphodiesterase class I)
MALHQMLNANHIFDVLTASSVAEARHSLSKRGSVDIAICDLQMKGPDGIEFIAQLARNHGARALIILSSAERGVLDGVAQLARRLGLDVLGYVQKPASVMTMASLLRLYCERQPQLAPSLMPSLRRAYSPEALLGSMENLAQQWTAHFQPKVSLKGEVLGVEALVRWQHPHFGLLPPGSFMAAIESAGLVVELTWRVMELALKLSADYRREHGVALPVAVNIAPRVLEEVDFVTRILGLLVRFDLAAEVLTLEIIEQVADDPEPWQLEGLLRLRLQGCKLSIDDFGTGASNIQRLLQLPFSELKIPAEFVRGMADDEGKSAVVAGAMFIARRMALEVVVEGVETVDDFHSMLVMGEPAIQGYFIARPMCASDLLAWIAARPERKPCGALSAKALQ